MGVVAWSVNWDKLLWRGKRDVRSWLETSDSNENQLNCDPQPFRNNGKRIGHNGANVAQKS